MHILCNSLFETEIITTRNVLFYLIQKQWGYFSQKDGETHTFCICERCYDEMGRERQWTVLPNVENTIELI